MNSAILAIASYLPGAPVTNSDLAADFPDWDIQRIADKTGILSRHIAGAAECASDLAFEAAQRLFSNGSCTPAEIDYVLLCTQSPDYVLPTTACLLQHRLGISKRAGALDFNLGCSGYVYGLGLAHGLIATGQAKRVLLLTGETYSKYIRPDDRSAVMIFGDAGSATLIGATDNTAHTYIPAYTYGTDGSGAEHLIVTGAGLRERCSLPEPDLNNGPPGTLSMNGPEVFHFALKVVPACVRELLEKTGKEMDEIDLFVFHQANRHMLDALRARLKIPEEKFFVSLASCGNTVSATIPIALECALQQQKLKPGNKVMLVGFGVGLSWGATMLRWPYLGVSA